MRRALAFFLLAVITLAADGAEQVDRCEPWQSEYSGDDATGSRVIALWHFNLGAELEDASGHGHKLALDGGAIAPGGRFGSCLESFRGWPDADKPHRARAAANPSLSPTGAFSIEMWIQPKSDLEGYPESFLIDKKYVAHADYQLILGDAGRTGTRVLRANLGFGKDSSTWHSDPMKLEPGRWRHIAFTYDGAGTGRFFLDGKPWGSEEIAGRKGIAPGTLPVSIGDRIGSYYHGFPGFIDEVRISSAALEYRRATFERVTDRSVFLRGEPRATARFRVRNLDRAPLEQASATISLAGLNEQRSAVPTLEPGGAAEIEYPIDTALRPDAYRLIARMSVPGPEPYQSEERFDVRIVPRQPPRFPVLMWGVYGNVREETERLRRIGFTHVLGMGADYSKIWEAGQPTEPESPEKMAEVKRMLDQALADDLTVVASLSPGAAMRNRDALRRVGRDGKPTSREDICGLIPELSQYCYNVGASVARAYGGYPAFGAAMVHTEVRDHAAPCFHEHDRAAFRQKAGFDIPTEVAGPRGVRYERLPDFPASRVIPDDHPLYVYYRWYWKEGDGWNGLNSQLVRGLKSTGRDDIWTYHDPAARVASVYGSGGEVDVLSQWTYSYPDPIRIGVATDELLALAAGAESPQQVMKMTQIIWYRGQTAPEPKAPAAGPGYQARWEREQPDAPFITIAPMHLREAFWTKIARPIKGIMYHGWQSLVPTDEPAGYRYTHPQTQEELARLVSEVVRPLGPTLLELPGVKSDVAFLESFAAEMFAGRGTFGWGGTWAGDAYHVLLYAHLQPEIVFDETIVARGLDGYKVLVMPDCDVLTQSVVERVRAFQAQGGIVVGDERLAPAITPDIALPVYQRTGRADQDKAALLSLAADLRARLGRRYAWPVDSSNPEIIPYRRHGGTADYVFVVNDRREYGQYVGQHGIVMENGLPSAATISMARSTGHVYDLVAGRPVPTRQEGGKLAFDVELGPCDGRVFMVSDQAMGGIRVQAPAAVDRGATAAIRVEVVGADDQPLNAVVPLHLSIRDAEGRPVEYSGYYGAVAGMLDVKLDIAVNDTFGTWQVDVREMASGRTATRYFRVNAPADWPPVEKPVDRQLANPVQPKG